MTIDIFFSSHTGSLVPDHIRITRSISGETGTVTFTFKQINLFSYIENRIEFLNTIIVKTPHYSYYTKDIRIIWANGKPKILEAIFVINQKDMVDSFFQNLQIYAADKGLIFTQNL